MILYIVLTMVAIYALISSIINRFRFYCYQEAASMVSRLEGIKNLTNTEKYNAVVEAVQQTVILKPFRNRFIDAYIHKVVMNVYNSYKFFTIAYIDRKTGYDVEELVKTVQGQEKQEISE